MSDKRLELLTIMEHMGSPPGVGVVRVTPLFSFLCCVVLCFVCLRTSATCGPRTAYPSGAPELPPVFSGVCVTRSFALYVCFVDRYCSFVLFRLVIVLSVLLRYTDSDYPFGIFKLFLCPMFPVS